MTSTGMRDFAKEMINRGHRQFLVDMVDCSVMDSTFMGTLAGIGLRLKEIGQGEVFVFNANERNEQLLRNLGLDHILNITREGIPAPARNTSSLEILENASIESGEMLEAHEALVEVSPGNLEKFKDVLDYLRQDLQLPSLKQESAK